MPASGGEARLLTPDTFEALDAAPVRSPDNRKVAFIVKATARSQREGVELRHNPTIDLWNSLVNGRP